MLKNALNFIQDTVNEARGSAIDNFKNKRSFVKRLDDPGYAAAPSTSSSTASFTVAVSPRSARMTSNMLLACSLVMRSGCSSTYFSAISSKTFIGNILKQAAPI